MRIFRVSVLPLVLVALLVFAPLPTMPGCNSKRAMDEAAEAAKDIGGGVRDVTESAAEAYHKNLIDLNQKDRLADLLIRISQGGQKGVAALSALEASGVTELSGDNRAMMDKLFTDEVVAPFLQLLGEFARLSPEANAAIRATFASLRTTVLLFSRKIGRADVERQVEQWEAGFRQPTVEVTYAAS
jgi:hypothetical protein